MKLKIPPSLRHRRYRLLWFGLLVSIAGTQMQVWAIFWHIRTLTDQPIALGAVGLARIIPVIIFSLIGGAVADVANRRKVMFITQLAMALGALVLALLTFSGQIALWQIYALTALQATAVAFDAPSRQSLVPNLVPASDLPNAFSMSSLAMHTGAIIGPALSGLVIAYWGQPYTYLFNAISYLAVLLALTMPCRAESPGATFLMIFPDARSTALGGCGAASRDLAANTYYTPAALAWSATILSRSWRRTT